MDLLSEYALCLGVCRHNKLQPNVHLLRLDDPHLALTRSWYPGEQFEAGKWYRKDHHQKRLYKLVDDIVKTIAVRTMDYSNAAGQSTFELVLPVYFVPDFTGGFDLGAKLPMLKDPEKAAVPVCPLFGPEGIEVLPPAKWLNGNDSNKIYSDGLYALKINISYTSGDSPVWTPQSVGQLKPWDYEQYPIVSQLCSENRTEGIVINQAMRSYETGRMQYCLIADKQAHLFIGVFPESEAKTVGENLQFWPMQLDFYEFPLVLALGCPQEEGNNRQSIIQHSQSQFIEKCASNEFKFKVEKKELEKLSQDVYHIAWLGKIIDPFHCVDEKLLQSIMAEHLLEIHAQPQWCLKKRSVCWICISDVKECSNASSSLPEMNLTRQKAVTSDQVVQSADNLRAINLNSEGSSSDKSAMDTSSSLQPISSNPNASLVRKKAIAAFMTISCEGGEPVFLFWDVNAKKFNRKCYAEFHENIAFPMLPADFGKWYELTYSDIPGHEMRITVLDYRKTEQRAVTRVRDGKCAQFSTNQDRYVKLWHAKYPCKAKNNCYEDMGWWPWLCRTCSPDLRDLSPPVVRELSTIPSTSKSVAIQNKEVLSPSLEELAAKMQNSLALEEGNIVDYPPDTPSLPVKKTKQKQDVKKQSQQLANVSGQKSASVNQIPVNINSNANNTQTALAVLLTVRDTKDLVFLFFNGQEKKFTNRIYADPIGRWYTLSYKLNATAGLQNGQKIAIVSAKLISKGPVETRVHNGQIAQPIFVAAWHKSEWHNRSKSDLPDAKSAWWPQLCLTCYPTANAAGLEQSKAQVKAGKSKRQYTTVAPGMEEEYTDSEPDTESCVTGEVGDDLSSGEDGSEDEESPNITPTGSPKPDATACVNYLVQSQFPDLAERPFNGFFMTKLADISNSPAESTKIQQNGNVLLDGGFGSARLRRLQLAKSASSSSTPSPCSVGSGSK